MLFRSQERRLHSQIHAFPCGETDGHALTGHQGGKIRCCESKKRPVLQTGRRGRLSEACQNHLQHADTPRKLR